MEFPHDGESIYYRYQATYVRNWAGDLIYCTGPETTRIQETWNSISACLGTRDISSTNQPQFHHVKLDGDFQGWELHEFRRTSTTVSTGIILSDVVDHPSTKRDFETFFCQLLLREANLAVTHQRVNISPLTSSRYDEATEEIVSLFDRFLRYQGENDKWIESGRTYFAERVRHFTSQGRRIELCLPAFPCKSSNLDKVTGKDPDRGELLALERLHSFIEAVEKIYDVGAKLWIISDGHVFSDCIGVDDEDVDSYGLKLIKMNRAIGLRRGNTDRVGFKSLVDLFELERYKHKQSKLSQLDIPTINHYVETRVTTEAELCRRILMAGCQSQRSGLRARIESQDPAILALYRGFSRFMLEDLEHHPFTRTMSRSKQKKLSAKVAFEMIMRNQAYSNLVELLFPNHIRLSIHAHNNAGPKFGIQLFDPAVVRAVETLSPNSNPMTSRDLLHIPTPWHNSVVKVVGSKILCVTKAKVVRDALADGGMTGSLLGQENQIDSIPAVYFTVNTTPRKRDPADQQETAHKEPSKPTPQVTIASGREGIASLVTKTIILHVFKY
ncbi:Pyoverdine/dityrosine biosynthesis protein-domain-containing protein [Annulohypoxylon maeteangense]|uniref:Pyoverdine/dityrosine biosynthesis protein-domain-containing protein n=1 Tax=Annulohypoxylon maeteangense TaxID=1927788 RepID=UPI002007C512|nr:Pyoverdine/dityrosine biosynthesis protein-domain-containing protein [Annulohypoxylon maeteangense]KAI0881580.1 Pyoverdine/dityrosine biosynthesis protein-domain-containing protein [Annulohypoxylon maeteangense]